MTRRRRGYTSVGRPRLNEMRFSTWGTPFIDLGIQQYNCLRGRPQGMANGEPSIHVCVQQHDLPCRRPHGQPRDPDTAANFSTFSMPPVCAGTPSRPHIELHIKNTSSYVSRTQGRGVAMDERTMTRNWTHLLDQLRRPRSPLQQVVTPWQHYRWRSKLELGLGTRLLPSCPTGTAGLSRRWPWNGAAKEVGTTRASDG